MNTKSKTNVVYAIYPNANGFGFVYMENARKLIEYGSVRINPISNRKILDRIKKSIAYFRPTILVLTDPDCKSSRTGKRTRRLVDRIMDYAQSEKLSVEQYSRDQVRDVFEGFGVRTKYEISQFLLTEFKELEPKRPKERKQWVSEDRNMGIFDALSLATCWFWLNE